MVGNSRISQLPISLHSDTYSGNAYNGLHGNLQTTSSKFYALLSLRIALILQFRCQRWPCTKQPSWNISNNISNPYFLLSIKLMGVFKANGDQELLKSFHLDMVDGHPLNSHVGMLPTTSFSKPFVLMSRNLIG